MKLSIPLSSFNYRIPFDTLQKYLNEESLKRVRVVGKEVKIHFEQVLNIQIEEKGDTADDRMAGGMETRSG